MSKSLRFPPNLSVLALSPEMNDQSRSPWALFFLTYPRKKHSPHSESSTQKGTTQDACCQGNSCLRFCCCCCFGFVFFFFFFFFKETLFPREIQVYRFCADAERSGKEKKQVGFFLTRCLFTDSLRPCLFSVVRENVKVHRTKKQCVPPCCFSTRSRTRERETIHPHITPNIFPQLYFSRSLSPPVSPSLLTTPHNLKLLSRQPQQYCVIRR